MARDHSRKDDSPPYAADAEQREDNNTKRVGFDYEYYTQILDADDLTEDQKRELLEALWSIMYEFAMLGFSVHPIQHASGKPKKFRTILSARLLDALKCLQPQKTTEEECGAASVSQAATKGVE